MPGKRVKWATFVALVALLSMATVSVSAAPIVERRGKWGSPALLRRYKVEAVESQTVGPFRFVGAEYGYSGPASVAAGDQELVLENQGAQDHRVWVLRLPEGLSERELSLGLDAALEDGASVLAEVVVRVGAVTRVSLQLETGRHALFIRNTAARGSGAGMVRLFTVTGPGAVEGSDSLPYT